MTDRPTVGIIGGGLSGLAAASILCQHDFDVEVFEAKKFLGGRAGSFLDPATGELVDHCQHVAMGCCTAFLDFCERTGVRHLFRRDEVLRFFSPDARRYDVRGSSWLPAPVHLGPSLWGLGYLNWREKFRIARSLLTLARSADDEGHASETIGAWLRKHGETQRTIDRFWSVVLFSALGEEIENASVAAARKVFVDGFMAHPQGFEVYVPQAPLGEIYEQGVAQWLTARGVKIHLESPVATIESEGWLVLQLQLNGRARSMDEYVLAVPWDALPRLLSRDAAGFLGNVHSTIAGSPITSIHLWFDRAITDLPHAVFVGRQTQWVFSHGRSGEDSLNGPGSHHYQAVISASQGLRSMAKDALIAEVLADLRATFSQAAAANLTHHRVVTWSNAVFSYRPGLDEIRPRQRTHFENLFLAGDWTATGWPSTMESAVRSGYLAAMEILKKHGCETDHIIPPDLPHGWLVRWLLPSC